MSDEDWTEHVVEPVLTMVKYLAVISARPRRGQGSAAKGHGEGNGMARRMAWRTGADHGALEWRGRGHGDDMFKDRGEGEAWRGHGQEQGEGMAKTI
jgi:hypothetical protein